MKPKQIFLKGASLFIISLILIVITVLTVYLTGVNYDRSFVNNFYVSLGIISGALFLFMSYGLYWGFDLIDNYPNIPQGSASIGDFTPEVPNIDLGDSGGGEGLIVSILMWILMAIIFVFLLWILQTVVYLVFTSLMAMLYWVFFGALKQVFSKSSFTRGHLGYSLLYALVYTLAYTGWIFVIMYLAQDHL